MYIQYSVRLVVCHMGWDNFDLGGPPFCPATQPIQPFATFEDINRQPKFKVWTLLTTHRLDVLPLLGEESLVVDGPRRDPRLDLEAIV